MIIDRNNNKVKKENAVERLNKSISDLDQLKQKQSTLLQNKMVQVVYQLFNSFVFNKEFEPLFSKKLDQIPLWFRINKSEFDELKSNIYNNQNNKDFKITINKKTYDLKNTKKVWTKITKNEISRNEAKKLYKELIQKDIDALKREKSNSIKKNNILELIKNIGAIFTGAYLHYEEVPKETIFEINIAERVKSRRQRLDIINKKKENINNKLFSDYFDYSNPDTMIKRLIDASDKKNKNMVESINKNLNKTKKH